MDKATRKIYQERDTRYVNTVFLKPADRVPTSLPLSYLPARYCGIKFSDSFYDFPRWKEAFLKTAIFLSPDRVGYFPNQSGHVMEGMGVKTTVWPGHGVDENRPHQFVEGEYMQAAEYDQFLADQSDFNVRFLAPRFNGLLAPLSKLPPLDSMMNMVPYATLSDPEFASMLRKLLKISKEAVKWQKNVQDLFDSLNEAGFPGKSSLIGGGVPFDMISDFLRGMRGAMLDMYRCPDKLMAACEKMSKQTLKRIAGAPKATDYSQAFIALHRGADGFMSIKQFEKFYWPHLKKLVEALVDGGHTPDIFFEGDYTQRLEFLLELPRGKVIARFDRTDMAKAGKILGGKICISGGMPSTLLQTGTRAEVEKYAMKLIDNCARDGGYIMSPGSSLDEVNPQNLKALVDFTAVYGKYK
ncbi:MAG TPA: uroporphyrinogen decarboxylase family protein [Dehalococcoidales bacterium]|nr:uroporphyrinogen decarboxylase family protein [Dehalococcoidales bacterium]